MNTGVKRGHSGIGALAWDGERVYWAAGHNGVGYPAPSAALQMTAAELCVAIAAAYRYVVWLGYLPRKGIYSNHMPGSWADHFRQRAHNFQAPDEAPPQT